MRRPAAAATLQLVVVAALLPAATAGIGLLIGDRVPVVDGGAAAWAAAHRSAGLTTAMTVLTDLGSIYTLGPVVLVAAAWLGFRRRFADAAAALGATVGTVALMNLAKAVVDRGRPTLDPVLEPGSPSFPSGHAAQSAAVLLVLAVVLTRRRPSRTVALVLALALALGVGVTRVYLGVHYPSDVVAGWLLGALWTLAVLRALDRPAVQRRGGAPAGRATGP